MYFLSCCLFLYSVVVLGLDELINPPFASSSASCADPNQRFAVRQMHEGIVLPMDKFCDQLCKTNIIDEIEKMILSAAEVGLEIENDKIDQIKMMINKNLEGFRALQQNSIDALKQKVIKSKYSYKGKKAIVEFMDVLYLPN